MDETCGCSCGRPYCASRRGKAKARTRRRAEWRAKVAKLPAPNSRKNWTGPEMELALRRDLTVREIATRLGRSYKAVEVMRRKCLYDPKYVQVVGVSLTVVSRDATVTGVSSTSPTDRVVS